MAHRTTWASRFIALLLIAATAFTGPISAAVALAQTTPSSDTTETAPIEETQTGTTGEETPPADPPAPPTTPTPPTEEEPAAPVVEDLLQNVVDQGSQFMDTFTALRALPSEERYGCMIVSNNVTMVGESPAASVEPHPVWTKAFEENGAEWIWAATDSAAYGQSVVSFTRSFFVDEAGYATLDVAADNRYEVSVNGEPVDGCDGSGENNFNMSNGPSGSPESGGPDSCEIYLQSGENTVTFTVTNDGGPANPGAGNPAGLYFRITGEEGMQCGEEPYVGTVEICKVEEEDEEWFGLSGWEVYLAGDTVETLEVPTNDPAGIDTNNDLASGVLYLITSMGTWTNQGGANVVDTEYSSTNSWATVMDGYDGYSTNILELQINSQFDPSSNWGPYNDEHEYSRLFTDGADAPVNFRIFDGTGTTQNEGWFGDNRGVLDVRIDEAFGGTTGKDGCVTVEVPFGEYKLGEIAQKGWNLAAVYDGEDMVWSPRDEGVPYVDVNEAFETFTLVNEGPTMCEISSDETTIEGSQRSYIQTFIHQSWTAMIDGAAWIWGDEAIVDPVGTETQTFTKKFVLDELPANAASLTVAADNSYSVTLNSQVIGGDTSEDNYTDAAKDIISIPADKFVVGENTLTFTVTNFAMGGGTEETNPAGLMYRLVIDGTDCEVVPPPPPPPTEQTIVVTGNTAAGENQPGWLFGRDLSTQTPFSFVMGTSSIGTGSLYVPPITNTVSPAVGSRPAGVGDKFIAELFMLTPMASVEDIAFDFQIAAPNATVEEQFYLNVYANFGVSSPTKFYDCRYDVVATVGSTNGYTTVTFDPNLTYPVRTNGGTSASPFPCPASPAAMDGISAGSSIRAIAINVGDTSASDTGVSGHLDKVVVDLGSTITTYDFEPVPPAPPAPVIFSTNGNGGGGGGPVQRSSTGGSDDEGEVLGESVTGEVLGASCPLITDFMREGMTNDTAQVKLLQEFLNTEMGLMIPTTGFFGALTTAAVNAFQLKYASEVLAPWGTVGLSTQPTGYVYKTTLWKINDIACPDLNQPFPQLP